MSHKRIRLGIAARRYRGRRFGEQTSYLRGLLALAASRGISAFVYEWTDIDWEDGSILGWTWRKKGWKRTRRALPDVVHDRSWRLGPRAEREMLRAVERFKEMGIPIFNPDFGDKYNVHCLLSSFEPLREHLPETLPLTAHNLAELARRYPAVFVKPRRGRQGKGISVCRLIGARWKVARHFSSGRVKSQVRSSAPGARDACTAGKAEESFLAQQGLDLVRVKGGTIDIRVIVQRDGEGEWHVTGVGVRAGRKGGFVSNLHAGGRALSLGALARRSKAAGSPKRLQRRVARLALEVAQGLSSAYPEAGEIGLDLGLDTDGRLWILEVNRQPGRALFARAGLRRSWRRSRIRVIEFARFLALKGKGESA